MQWRRARRIWDQLFLVIAETARIGALDEERQIVRVNVGAQLRDGVTKQTTYTGRSSQSAQRGLGTVYATMKIALTSILAAFARIGDTPRSIATAQNGWTQEVQLTIDLSKAGLASLGVALVLRSERPRSIDGNVLLGSSSSSSSGSVSSNDMREPEAYYCHLT